MKHWDYDTCYKEAMKYNSRSEFATNSSASYKVACKNGWLDNYNWFESKHKPNGYWNRETCLEEAKKYKSKAEFQQKCGSAYVTATKNGWINDYTWFERPVVHNKKWTYETCLEEAKRYKTKTEFRNLCSGAYNAAYKNGWLNDYTWLEDGNKIAVENRRKWNKETCYEEAKKYKSKVEFRKLSSGTYDAAYKNGWLVEYTWLESGLISRRRVYVVYYYIDDETNAVYVGLSNNIKRRHRQHSTYNLRHGKVESDIVYKYFHDTLGKDVPEPIILEKNLLSTEAQERERYYVELFTKEGRFVLNSAKAGSLGAYGKWTKEMTYEEAKKYKSRLEFEKGNNSAYNAAKRNKWLDDYTWFEKKLGKWTYETCYEEAKKHKSKVEFRKKSGGAYNVALKKGWLSNYTWFEQKVKPIGYWNNYERCYDAAKKCKARSEFGKQYPNAYEWSRKNGWLGKFTWFEKPTHWNKKWNYETCKNEAKKYKYQAEFQKNAGGAFQVAWKNGWLKDYTWFEDGVKIRAEKKRKWNRETCFNEAKKYASRCEFAKNNRGAYKVARENNWLDEYTWFMTTKRPNGYWDYDNCFKEAKKYKTRGEFRKFGKRAYNVALKNGWISDWFSN